MLLIFQKELPEIIPGANCCSEVVSSIVINFPFVSLFRQILNGFSINFFTDSFYFMELKKPMYFGK